MKLEVGMYVRLHGKIGKIEHICMCEQCKLRGFYEPVVDFGHEGSDYVSVYWKNDLKASNNIIDLIEEGDYVNGYKVVELNKKRIGFGISKISCHYCYWGDDELKIETVITREQIESMQYKVN